MLPTVLENPAALAAIAGALFLAWRNRAKIVAAVATSTPSTDVTTDKVPVAPDAAGIRSNRLQLLRELRYDAADQADATQRTADLKFLDEARALVERLSPAADVLLLERPT